MKKVKKIYSGVVLTGVMCILSLTGCTSLNYTEEQENIIAGYAANLLLRHDENYKYEYISEEETTIVADTEETSEQPQGTDLHPGDDNTNESVIQGGEVITDSKSIAQSFHMPEGMTAEYVDYEIVDRYPSDNSNDGIFVMKSVDNYKLLVVKFKITNTTGQDIAVNMMASNAKYKGIVNETKKYNAQLTLLLDALNTYEGTMAAGSSQNLVLIYQTQIESKDDINSLSVAVSDSSGSETVIKLK